ncbi:hypothetical protein O5D80_007393 [Batrachochytrium dendrobatidis]|nr:hypothetical protein O5D80_007393 [Batrachochytrium dendrobatidis]
MSKSSEHTFFPPPSSSLTTPILNPASETISTSSFSTPRRLLMSRSLSPQNKNEFSGQLSLSNTIELDQNHKSLKPKPNSLESVQHNSAPKTGHAETNMDMLRLQLEAYDRIQRIQDRVLSGQDVYSATSSQSKSTCLLENWRKKVWELMVQRNWAELEHLRCKDIAESKLKESTLRQQEMHRINMNLKSELLELQQNYNASILENNELKQSCSKLNHALETVQNHKRNAAQQLERSHLKLHEFDTVTEKINLLSKLFNDRLNIMNQQLAYMIDRLQMIRVIQDAEKKDKHAQQRQLKLLQTELHNLRTDRRILLERLSLAEMPMPTLDCSVQTDQAWSPVLQNKPELNASAGDSALAISALKGDTPQPILDLDTIDVMDKLRRLELLDASLQLNK